MSTRMLPSTGHADIEYSALARLVGFLIFVQSSRREEKGPFSILNAFSPVTQIDAAASLNVVVFSVTVGPLVLYIGTRGVLV